MIARGHDPLLTWASERHLRLSFDAVEISGSSSQVHQALAAIERARPQGLIALTPAASTILLEFLPADLDEHRAVDAVRQALAEASELPASPQPDPIEIPVCYEPPCAPDAEDVARLHNIDPASLIRLHSQPVYTVRFIGFAPGFGYLSGMPSALATPRLDTPRVRVPAGSVGIAGDQTGIYPTSTAGGWRLIGRTPLQMFDAARDRPSLLAPGDRVRFTPIDLPEFEARLRGMSGHA